MAQILHFAGEKQDNEMRPKKVIEKSRQEVWALTSVVKIGKTEEREHYWKGRMDRCDSSLWWRERKRE